jgi:hypothetical protein
MLKAALVGYPSRRWKLLASQATAAVAACFITVDKIV